MYGADWDLGGPGERAEPTHTYIELLGLLEFQFVMLTM